VRRNEPGALLDGLGVDITGKLLLDIGSGFGTTIDSAKAHGAICEYVEYGPVFYTLNRQQGF
jgi:hypothetical protein